MPIDPEALPLPTTLDAQWQLVQEAREAEQRGDYGLRIADCPSMRCEQKKKESRPQHVA